MWLTRAALAHPIAITLFYVAVAIVGLAAASGIGRSVLPAIDVASVSISATYPGASPSEMERLVVEPIEDALDSVPNVERVKAAAQSGFMQVVVRFYSGVSMQTAQTDVQHAVDGARVNLPSDLLPPLVVRDDPSQIPIAAFAVSSAVLGESEVNRAVDRTVLPALRATSGVGAVRVAGERARTFLVAPKRAALDALGATDLDVLRAIQGAYAVFGGGTASDGATEATVGIRSPAESIEALSAVPVVFGSASSVRTGDIADDQDSFADATTVASFNGNGTLLLYVTRAQGADTIATIQKIRRTIARLTRAMPLLRIEEFHSDLPFTEAAIGGVKQTLFEGIALTVLVMLVFLRSWRNATVAALAIPSSILATLVAMRALGFTFDVLSLMGLSMTIGILVDDSIVIIEAIVRARERGMIGEEAALAGRGELGGAAIAITLVDVAVFLPIALMSGIVGAFMREFAAVIAIATSFSLLVSFTLTPLLCARWSTVARVGGRLPWTLRNPLATAVARWFHAFSAGFAKWESHVTERYTTYWLPAAWRYRWMVLGLGVTACVASFVPVATSFIPTEFSPPSNRGEVVVNLRYPPGTPIASTDAGARVFAQRLLADGRVSDVATIAGRGFDGANDIVASNLAEIFIELTDPTSSGDDVARFAKSLGAIVPGAAITRNGRGMGGMAPISFTIGGDATRLAEAGAKVAALLQADSYADDVMRSDVGTAPHLELRVDDARAQLLGIDASDVAQTARIATGGALATRVRTPDGLIDVVVRDRNPERTGIAAYRSTNVRANNGTLVPIGSVLHRRITSEPLVIERENRERTISVNANPRDGVPVGVAMAPVRGAIARALPPGTFVEQRGDLEQFLNTVTNIMEALGLSALLVYAILAILYHSYRLPLVVMTTVPLAAIGAFGGLALLNVLHEIAPRIDAFASQTLNLYSMLGIVMLVGLVAKNGILLVEFAERDVRRDAAAFDAIQRAARRRFRPIVMTTFAMIFGMLPLALGDTAGAEYRKALGTVVIGGLTSSLALTLFFVPIVYVLMHARTQRKSLHAYLDDVRSTVRGNA
jgi:HAE1 family hydrophobic/amphiphilic exporter-1